MGVLVQSVVVLALSIALPHWIIRFDERRLAAIQYSRGWNSASHWSAIVAFSWLCVPLHFAKTRRNFTGFALGLGVAGVGLLLQVLVSAGLAALGG